MYNVQQKSLTVAALYGSHGTEMACQTNHWLCCNATMFQPIIPRPPANTNLYGIDQGLGDRKPSKTHVTKTTGSGINY